MKCAIAFCNSFSNNITTNYYALFKNTLRFDRFVNLKNVSVVLTHTYVVLTHTYVVMTRIHIVQRQILIILICIAEDKQR